MMRYIHPMNDLTLTHRSELRPLPMRITQLQFERLHKAREFDGMSVQEHIRRALDLYLDKVEQKRPGVLTAAVAQRPEAPAGDATADAVRTTETPSVGLGPSGDVKIGKRMRLR